MNNTTLLAMILSIISILFIIGCSQNNQEHNNQINDDSLVEQIDNEDIDQQTTQTNSTPEIEVPKPTLRATLIGPRYGEISFTGTWECNITAEYANYTITWAVASLEQLESADSTRRMSEQFEYTTCKNSIECTMTFDKPEIYSIGCVVENTTLGLMSVGQHYINITKQHKNVSHIIALGDSLTYGETLENPSSESWVALLDASFSNATQHNYAISGFTTTDLIAQELPRLKADLNNTAFIGNNFIFVWIGANDLRTFVDISTFITNYRTILSEVNTIQNQTGASVFILTIPDVSKLSVAQDAENQVNSALASLGINAQINLREIGADIIAQYNAAFVNESSIYNYTIIDTHSAMKLLNDSDISSDKFHPNKIGHEKIYGFVNEKINEAYPMVEFG